MCTIGDTLGLYSSDTAFLQLDVSPATHSYKENLETQRGHREKKGFWSNVLIAG